MFYNVPMKLINILLALLLITERSVACDFAEDSSRIAVGGGSITEILYFLGAEEKIVAVDITSNYPTSATSLPSIGYVRNLSTEGILSLSPTLVIGEDDMGPADVIAQIENSGVDIISVEEQHNSNGILAKIRCVANVVGSQTKANKLIEQQLLPVIQRLENQAKSVRQQQQSVLFILSMNAGSPIVAGKNVSANGLINMLGARNSMLSFDGWKPANVEAIIAAAPDVILISNRGLEGIGDLSELRSHPTLRLTPAAQTGKIFAMDGMALLGFGPRTLSTALTLAEKINSDND